MGSQNVLKMQQCDPAELASRPAGHWCLDPGRAITLRGATAAVLQIGKGRVWATVEGPHTGPGNDLGDVVLNAGERLALAAGQGVVIEPWLADADKYGANPSLADPSGAAWFSWDAVPVESAESLRYSVSPESGAEQALASRWQAAVAQPLRDFALALGMAAHALGRLGLGLAGLTEFLVAGRGRVLPQMESNPP